MADLSDAYDPTGGAVSEGRGGPLPAGNYVLAMAKNERKFTKSGNGDWFLECEFEVKGEEKTGAFAGRRTWHSFNLKNQSPEAQKIAWEMFNAMCHACGRLPGTVRNADDLLGIQILAYVSIDRKDTDRNRISSFKPLNGAPAPSQAGRAAPPPAAQQSGAPAWRQPPR